MSQTDELLARQREACREVYLQLTEDHACCRKAVASAIAAAPIHVAPIAPSNPSCFGARLDVEACFHGCPVTNECYKD